MLKTILIIVLSVTLFGIIFFFIVKRSIKKTLDYYLSQKNKEKWFKSFCKILKILLLVFAKLF